MTAPPRPHHHGNLREALISAGLAILSEGQTLTLRQAAVRAGVSHAAPAHHFDGLAGLLTAIATRAFADFSARMITARDAAAKDPVARLQAICAGYLDFASQNSGLFHLMFTSTEVKRDDPDLMQSSAQAYGILHLGCAPFVQSPQEAEGLELAVWSLVHGYAALWVAAGHSHPRHFVGKPDFAPLLMRLLPSDG